MSQAVRYVGLDLGQLQDYTALTVIEQRWEPTQETPGAAAGAMPGAMREEILLGHIWRPNIGTSYRAIVDYTAKLLQREHMRASCAGVVVDATSVGRPVVEQMRAAGLPVPVIAVTITGGDTASQVARDEYRVPKKDLAGELAVLLQAPDGDLPGQDLQPRLRFADGLRLSHILRAELNTFQAKIRLSGEAGFEAGPAGEWREAGGHDDIVLALALPLWYARTGRQLGASGRVAAGPPLILPGHRGRTAAAERKTPLQLERERRERERYDA
jgi:hypothetical protein